MILNKEIFAVMLVGCNCSDFKNDLDILAKINGYKTIGNIGNFYIVYVKQKKIFMTDVVKLDMPILNGKDNREEIEKYLLNL